MVRDMQCSTRSVEAPILQPALWFQHTSSAPDIEKLWTETLIETKLYRGQQGPQDPSAPSPHPISAIHTCYRDVNGALVPGPPQCTPHLLSRCRWSSGPRTPSVYSAPAIEMSMELWSQDLPCTTTSREVQGGSSRARSGEKGGVSIVPTCFSRRSSAPSVLPICRATLQRAIGRARKFVSQSVHPLRKLRSLHRQPELSTAK